MRTPEYVPELRRAGEDSPQTNPADFSDHEIELEIKYLMRLNKRHGTHPLRTIAYLNLMMVLREREERKACGLS